MLKGKPKTLVLGLGNPILSDDSVGCRVALALPEKIHLPDVDIKEASIAGLDFLEVFAGYNRVIIIDAIQTKNGAPGQLYRFGPEKLPSTCHTSTLHDVSLGTALELGKKLQLDMPQEIIIFAIEAADITSFGEACTPDVEKAIPECVAMVIRELQTTP